jgi:hypothetical protein
MASFEEALKAHAQGKTIGRNGVQIMPLRGTFEVNMAEYEKRLLMQLCEASGIPTRYFRNPREVSRMNEQYRKLLKDVTRPGWRIFDRVIGQSIAWAPSRREANLFIQSERFLRLGSWGDYALIRTKGERPAGIGGAKSLIQRLGERCRRPKFRSRNRKPKAQTQPTSYLYYRTTNGHPEYLGTGLDAELIIIDEIETT